MAGLNNKHTPKRGEVWVTDLRPTIGWEVAKKRPALIISNNEINKISPLVIVIPVSSQIPAIIGPERLFVEKEKTGLDKDSVILMTQIRVIDKSRVGKKVGKITGQKLLEVEESLRIVLGFKSE